MRNHVAAIVISTANNVVPRRGPGDLNAGTATASFPLLRRNEPEPATAPADVQTTNQSKYTRGLPLFSNEGDAAVLKVLALVVLSLLLLTACALSQNIADDQANAPRPVKLVPPAPTGPISIRCGALFDGKSDRLQQNVVISIEGERIKAIGAAPTNSAAQVIDLSDQTCLPGMVESHTHVFLQGDRKP